MKKEEIFEGIDELSLDLKKMEKVLKEATNLHQQIFFNVNLLRAKIRHVEAVNRSVEAQLEGTFTRLNLVKEDLK